MDGFKARAEVSCGTERVSLGHERMITDLEEWMCRWLRSTWNELAVLKRSFCMEDPAAVL